MRLTIRAMRALQDLNIELQDGAVVLTGQNGAGKSTTCEILAALLTRDATLDRTAEQLKGVIRQGSRKGQASLGDSAGQISVSWPDKEMLTEGDPPTASMIATGRTRPARLKPKDRAAALVEALKADPTKAEWDGACAEAGIATVVRDNVWKRIAGGIGWDAASKWAADHAREQKGAWKSTANASGYPSKGAESWQAPGYDDRELIRYTIEQCDDLVRAAQQARDGRLKAQAVGAADRDRLVRLAEGHDQAVLAAENLEGDVGEARKTLAAAEARLAKVVKALPEARCPHCSNPVAVSLQPFGLLKPIGGISVDALSYEEHETAVRKARENVENLGRQMVDAQRREEECKAASEQLGKLPPIDPKPLAEAEAELDRHKAFREAVRVTHKCRDLHGEIGHLTKAAELTGPTGLRKKKLGDVLKMLNAGIAELCDEAGWPTIRIDDDLEFWCGEFHWRELSAGLKWRVDAVMALYIAERDGSNVVVLDGGDCLDAGGRLGIVALGNLYDMPIVLGMRVSLSDANKIATDGATVYRIDQGAAMPIEALPQAAE